VISNFSAWNAHLKRYSKQLLDWALTATGTMNTPGIAPTKRLVAIPVENVVLDLNEGLNPSESHLVRRKTTSRKEKAIEEDRRMPTISGLKLTFLTLMVIST
jgi:hypothetical protein